MICQRLSLEASTSLENFFQISMDENIDQALWRKLLILFLTPYWVNKPSYAQKWKVFGISMNFLTAVSLLPMSMKKNQVNKYRHYKTQGYVCNCPFISPFPSWHFKNSFRHPMLEKNQLLQKIQSHANSAYIGQVYRHLIYPKHKRSQFLYWCFTACICLFIYLEVWCLAFSCGWSSHV